MNGRAGLFVVCSLLAALSCQHGGDGHNKDCRAAGNEQCGSQPVAGATDAKAPELPPLVSNQPHSSDITGAIAVEGTPKTPASPTPKPPVPPPVTPAPTPVPTPVPPVVFVPLNWSCAKSAYQGRQIYTCGTDGNPYRCSLSGKVEWLDCKGKGCQVNDLGCDDGCKGQPMPACP